MTTFSVIVPAYNVEKYLKQCLDSIKQQTYTDFEVIIVDDCSTDNSVNIIQDYVNQDRRFKLVQQSKNKGVSAARNTALDIAAGEYIIFIDADDWVDKKMFENVEKGFRNNPTADVVWFNSYAYNEQNGEKRLFDQIKRKDHIEQSNEKELLYIVGCLWDKAYKRSKIEEAHLRFPEGLIVEDTYFTFAYSSKYPTYYMMNEPYYYYRKFRQGSYCTDDQSGNRIVDQFKIIPLIYKFLKEQNLLQQYSLTLLGLFLEYIRSILYLKDKHETILKMAKNTLDTINFPDEYKHLDKITEDFIIPQ